MRTSSYAPTWGGGEERLETAYELLCPHRNRLRRPGLRAHPVWADALARILTVTEAGSAGLFFPGRWPRVRADYRSTQICVDFRVLPLQNFLMGFT